MEERKEREGVSRRRVLSSLGWTAGSVVAGFGAGIATSASGEETSSPKTESSKKDPPKTDSPITGKWEYKKLDPDRVADRAYQVFPEGGCMYGPFAAVILEMADLAGEPFASFPIGMARYGFAGVAGWGSICGTLNGSSALFGLFTQDKKVCGRLCDGLFQWYRDAPLPAYQPKTDKSEVTESVAGSILCHVSSARWCITAQCRDIDAKIRKERCRRLAADVAKKATELLNAYHETKQLPEKYVIKDFQDQEFEAISKMNCGLCHRPQ